MPQDRSTQTITPPEQMAQIKESELLNLIDKTRALDATYKLLDTVMESIDFNVLSRKIVDIIPRAMGYNMGILLVIDATKHTLTKAAISETAITQPIIKLLDNQTKNISISFGYTENLSIKSLNEKKQYVCENLSDLLKPSVTSEESKVIQQMLNAKCHIATPLIARGRPVGVLIVSLSKDAQEVTDFEKQMLKKFSENAGIGVENSKLFSNLKMAKDDLHKAYENLKVLNKLKDEFLSVASHELRTPMTIVKSYLWMLEKQKAGKMNPKQMEYLQKALEGTQRMIALINDMLDISRFEQKKISFDLRQINICEAITDTLVNFEIEAKEKGVSLSLGEECKEIFVDADEVKLRDVLTNLVGNAIKFTKEGSVTIGITEEEEYVKIWIRDTGSGIDPADLEKLFHKFGRIDNSYTIASDAGGTGLGLYIVKMYIEGMGGRVGAWSQGLGKGSTFWFTLPKNKIKRFGEGELKEIDVPVQDVVTIDQSQNTPNN